MTITDVAQLAQIPMALIIAGDNDRKGFDDEALETLARSIERDGLAQPPTVRPLEDGRYEIVAGERRVRAMRLLGWDLVPAFVRSLSDDEAAATMLVENLVRVDLDPLEEARAFQSRIDQGSTVADLANLVGLGQRTVRARLALLELSHDAQILVTSGNLTLACAAQMVGLDTDRQNVALRALRSGDLSLAAFTAVCDRLRREQETEPMFSADLFWSVEEYVVGGREAERTAKLSTTMTAEMLTTKEAAALAGIKEASVRRLRVRGTFPSPDGHFAGSPWWKPETVIEWKQNRRGPGRPRQLTLGE